MTLPFTRSQLAIAVAATLGASGAMAQTLGTEFQVNQGQPTNLIQPSADSASDAAGNFVVVWDSNNDPGGGIEATLFDNAGTAVVPAGGAAPPPTLITVNSTTVAGQQFDPSVAMNSGGDFVVAWQDDDDGYGAGVFAQRFTDTGSVAGTEINVPVNATSGNQADPQVAMADDGRFMVAWVDIDISSAPQIRMRFFDAAGNGLTGDMQVSNGPAQNAEPAIGVSRGPNPQYVIAWFGQDSALGDIDGGIFYQLFDADGNQLGNNQLANTTTAGDQVDPAVGVDGSNNFVVAWEATEIGSGGPYDIIARRFDSNGVAQGGEFPVNAVTIGDQTHVSVAMTPSGDHVIAWNTDDGDGEGLAYSAFDAAGNALPGEADVRINDTTPLNQEDPELAVDNAGNFVSAWRGETGSTTEIFARRASRVTTTPGNAVDLILEAQTEGKLALSPLALLAAGLLGALAWLRRFTTRR